MKIAIISINQPSLDSALRLKSYLSDHEIDIFGKNGLNHNLKNIIVYEKIESVFAASWERYDAIVCILSIGIVIRKIAPLLKSKTVDPAILAMSIDLSKVAPLLSGHLGGANELSCEITQKIKGCVNFISTATDQLKAFAFDMFAKQNGMQIENIGKLANISNRLINGQAVKVCTYKNIFASIDNKENLVFVGEGSIDDDTVVIDPLKTTDQLLLKPKIYLGIGCNRNTTQKEINEAFFAFLKRYGLEARQIKNIASFEAKQDEHGLLEFAKERGFDIKFFSANEINALSSEFSASRALDFFGLKGVSEPSAVLLSRYKELIITKQIYDNKITIAGAI